MPSVVPHPVAVDHPRPGGFGDRDHPAVDMGGYSGQQLVGHPPHAGRPVLAHQLRVAADATTGDDDGRGAKLEFGHSSSRRRHAPGRRRGFQDGAADADHRTAFDDQFVDLVAVREADHRVVGQPSGEDVHQARPGTPGEMKPGYRVAVTACVVPAAFGPANQGEDLQPTLAQPAALLPRGEVDVGVRPLPRPIVLVPVERGRAQPVLQRQLVAVLDAHPALLGAVDEEQATERPEGLPAQVGAVLLLDDQHAFTGHLGVLGQLGGRDQSGESGSDNDDVSVHAATR